MLIKDIYSAIYGQQKTVKLHIVRTLLLFTYRIWTKPHFLIGLSKHFLSSPTYSGASYLTLEKVSGGALRFYETLQMGLCATLIFLLHIMFTKLETCPLDWRTTIHWNVVFAIFQYTHISYIRVYGKVPDQYFKVSLFSNPGDNVLIIVKSRAIFVP